MIHFYNQTISLSNVNTFLMGIKHIFQKYTSHVSLSQPHITTHLAHLTSCSLSVTHHHIPNTPHGQQYDNYKGLELWLP
jgi:hypothetical protein